jgi:ribosome-binding protein aMBF1 (putative translation factor)
MAQSTTSRWHETRARRLADSAARERYGRTRRSVALTRAVLREIDARREAAGLSKAQLAQLVGVHPSAIRRLLSSQASNPTLKTVAEVLDILGLELKLGPRSRATAGAER